MLSMVPAAESETWAVRWRTWSAVSVKAPASLFIASAEWSSTAYIDHDVKIAMPLAVVATQHPRVTGPHDEPLSEKEQDEAFSRKAKDLAGMMEELGRYIAKTGK